MRMVVAGFLVVLLANLAACADDPDKKPLTPREQYDALVKEQGAAQQAFFAAVNKAKTGEGRQKAMRDEAPKLEKMLVKFVELAEKHPKDAVAVDALLVVMRNDFASQAGGTSKKKALAVLARDHATSDTIGPHCQELARGFDGQNEKLLRTILEKNPSKSVRAEACLALTQCLSLRALLAKRLASDKEWGKQLAEAIGKEGAGELANLDPARLQEEGAALTRQFAEKYVGELKQARLIDLCQQLAVSADKGSDTLLRKLMAHDKKEVKAISTLSLGQVLKQQADAKVEKDSKSADLLRKEAETLFESALEKYADVKTGLRGTIGETARTELYEIRHLVIGKPIPEVEAEDQDGKAFKLSDYKGKVVLLDFWSQF